MKMLTNQANSINKHRITCPYTNIQYIGMCKKQKSKQPAFLILPCQFQQANQNYSLYWTQETLVMDGHQNYEDWDEHENAKGDSSDELSRPRLLWRSLGLAHQITDLNRRIQGLEVQMKEEKEKNDKRVTQLMEENDKRVAQLELELKEEKEKNDKRVAQLELELKEEKEKNDKRVAKLELQLKEEKEENDKRVAQLELLLNRFSQQSPSHVKRDADLKDENRQFENNPASIQRELDDQSDERMGKSSHKKRKHIRKQMKKSRRESKDSDQL